MKPTPRQRELLKRLAAGDSLVWDRMSSQWLLNWVTRVNYQTATGASHRGLIELVSVGPRGSREYAITDAGRQALGEARDG